MIGTRAPSRPAARVVVGRRVAQGRVVPHEFSYYSVVTTAVAAPEPERERRTDRRIGTHLREGIVSEGPLRSRLDCLIRDLSRTGARLQLTKDRPLPRGFLLTDTATGTNYRARLMWQVGRDVGVKLAMA